MYERHIVGKKGEDYAVDYLKKLGYKIIERNFHCKKGEVDIIAKDKNEYVFIEVKTRLNFNYGSPAEAVTKTKKKHIVNTAKYYMYDRKLEKQFIRFDVIEIYLNKYKINHLKQVI